jgi:outer membrane protein assembly factor BamB
MGNVIFVDKNWNRVVEAGLDGRVVWECPGPEVHIDHHMKGFCGAMLTDVELLPNDHVLVLVGGAGVYELDRDGKVVWSYKGDGISHDADRLPNGNTLMACAGAEKLTAFPYEDPQAIEVNRNGEIVWSWHAKDEYLDSRYCDIRSKDANDWTHLNSVQRLDNGQTLLSIRNWNLLAAVDQEGQTAWSTGGGNLREMPRGFPGDQPDCPHTPVMLENGHIIISEPIVGRVIEWNPDTEQIVWSYPEKTWRRGGPYFFIRAAHRLPNGNTFIIDSKGRFIEVTSDGERVWQARIRDFKDSTGPLSKEELMEVPFFNADRRGMAFYGGR